jgi:hypothetical protein
MKFFLKLLLFTFLVSFWSAPSALAITVWDLLPNRTYFVLAGVEPATEHFRVEYHSNQGSQILFFSGTTLEEWTRSIEVAFANRLSTYYTPNLIRIADKTPIDHQAKHATMIEVVTSLIQKMAGEEKRYFIEADSFKFYSLGNFGLGKLTQMIPLVARDAPDQVEKGEARTTVGELFRYISAQTWTLSFKYNPETFRIIADLAWMSFRRGPCVTLSESSRFVDFQISPLADGISMEGTNLLGSLVARKSGRSLSTAERFSVSPPDHEIEGGVLLGRAIASNPAEIQARIVDLLVRTEETLKIQLHTPERRDLKAELIEAEAEAMSKIGSAAIVLAAGDLAYFQQSFRIDAKLILETLSVPGSRVTSTQDLVFGSYDRTQTTTYSYGLDLGRAGSTPGVQIEISGSLGTGVFHLSARRGGVSLPRVGEKPLPLFEYDFFTDPLATSQILGPLSLSKDLVGIRRFGSLDIDPKTKGDLTVSIDLSALFQPQGFASATLQIHNSLTIRESRLSSPGITPLSSERATPDPSARSSVSEGAVPLKLSPLCGARGTPDPSPRSVGSASGGETPNPSVPSPMGGGSTPAKRKWGLF